MLHSTTETSYKVHTQLRLCFISMFTFFKRLFTSQPDVGSVVNWNVLLFCSKVNSCVRKSVYLHSTFLYYLKVNVGTSPSMVNVYTPPASSCILIYIIWSLWEGKVRQMMRISVAKCVGLLRGWGRPLYKELHYVFWTPNIKKVEVCVCVTWRHIKGV